MRLIDAGALKASIEKKDRYNLGGEGRIVVCGMLDDAPTIDAEPVKHGRWVARATVVYCSCCHISWSKCFTETLRKTYKYCPNCGAKMDGGTK